VAKYCDEHVCLCVCLSVCLSARISPEPQSAIFTNFSVHVAYGRGSVGQAIFYDSDLIVHEVMLFQVNTKWRGRRGYLVPDMVEDIRNVSNFANRDKSRYKTTCLRHLS